MRPFGPDPVIEIKLMLLSSENFLAYGEAVILVFFFLTVCFIVVKLSILTIFFGSSILFFSIADSFSFAPFQNYLFHRF